MRLSQGHNVRKWSTDDANSTSENPESAVTSSPQGLYLHRTVPEAAALSWGNHISPGFLSKPKGRVSGACPAHSARGRGWGASQTGLNSRPQAEADRKAGAATPRGRSTVRTLNPVQFRQEASVCLSKSLPNFCGG